MNRSVRCPVCGAEGTEGVEWKRGERCFFTTLEIQVCRYCDLEACAPCFDAHECHGHKPDLSGGAVEGEAQSCDPGVSNTTPAAPFTTTPGIFEGVINRKMLLEAAEQALEIATRMHVFCEMIRDADPGAAGMARRFSDALLAATNIISISRIDAGGSDDRETLTGAHSAAADGQSAGGVPAATL